MENDQITTYGLIGYPLGHSLSPLMHNTAFRALDVDALYTLFPLKEEEIEPFLRDLKLENSPIFGLNVTVPYKETVVPFLDSMSPYAQKVMAVNTIVIDEERNLIGHNTDGPGFLVHLTELKCSLQEKRVAILGAGGAARAIVSVLCLEERGPQSVRLYDVDRERAKFLVKDLGQRMDASRVEVADSIDDLNVEIADILINATPIGLKKDDPVLVSEELFHEGLFVYDLIYNPAETPLLKMAVLHGCQVSNGLGMLLHQGILAFQHWAGAELSPVIREQMRLSLQRGEVI